EGFWKPLHEYRVVTSIIVPVNVPGPTEGGAVVPSGGRFDDVACVRLQPVAAPSGISPSIVLILHLLLSEVWYFQSERARQATLSDLVALHRVRLDSRRRLLQNLNCRRPVLGTHRNPRCFFRMFHDIIATSRTAGFCPPVGDLENVPLRHQS